MNTTNQSSRYAAIDIGTVTCRLLIADKCAHTLIERERCCAITNLGEGVDATGFLKQEAMQRVATEIARFKTIIEAHKDASCKEISLIATATSAARDAKNSAEFSTLLKGLGIQLTIIPGEREAELSFIGASHSFPGEKLLVVDIGGGSTELAFGLAGNTPEKNVSFDVGCRRITERFLKSDPPTNAKLEQARKWINQQFSDFFANLAQSDFVLDRLVGVAGSATSAVSVYQKMEVYDSSRVHKTVMDKKQLLSVYESLRILPLEARRNVIGLEPERASVVVAGLLILCQILDLAEQSSITVSESDILQGIILSTEPK